MKINSNSWHYKVVYATGFFANYCMPDTLCGYMFRLLILAPLMLLPCGAMILTVAVALLPITLVALMFGYYPTDILARDIQPYNGLPVGRFRVYPWHILVSVLFVFLTVKGYRHWGDKSLCWEVGILALVLSIVGIVRFSMSNKPSIFKDWLAARKEKVCPLIEYEDTE